MQRFNMYLPKELFDRIKLMDKLYNMPVSKMMTELMELGYIKKLEGNEEWEKKHTSILVKSSIN